MVNNIEQNQNEFLNKIEDIRKKFDAVTKQIEEGQDEQKRLQGEYRVTIELGLKLGYLTETKPEQSSAEVQTEVEVEPELETEVETELNDIKTR